MSQQQPQWTEPELRQRLTLLEQVLQERNVTIEALQRELRVANSKARITDEVQSENKVLRARLHEMVILQQQKVTNNSEANANSNTAETSSTSSTNSVSSSASTSKKEESILERLRKQLNETGAPSPLSATQFNSNNNNNHSAGFVDDGGNYQNLPKSEEEEVEEILEQAMDSLHVESKEDQLLRERLEKLTGKK